MATWATAFERDGWAVVGRLVEPDEVERLRALVDDLVARVGPVRAPGFQDLVGPADARPGAADDGVPGVAQVLAPHQHAPRLLDEPFLARAAEVGRLALGPEAVTTVAMIVAKPPRSSAPVPWHQDAAYWGHRKRTSGASIWIPLQDVDESNGCMQFASGTHTGGVLEHRHLGDDPAIHALELVDEALAGLPAPSVVPLPAGVASVHDGHTAHFTGPNGSDDARRALVLSVRNPCRDVPTPDRAPFSWDLAGGPSTPRGAA